MTYEEALSRLDGVHRSGNKATARCPVHQDSEPSLSIEATDGSNFVAHCHANRGCTFERIVASLRSRWLRRLPGVTSTSTGDPSVVRRQVAAYPYVNEHGYLLYQVVRYEPKGFRQRRPDGEGGWIYNLDGVRRVLYRLSELGGHRTVYICEGEKDADNLRARGLNATTCAQGAGKWSDEFTSQLYAVGVKEVVVLPDNDKPGEQHAVDVARSCVKAGLPVKIVKLPDLPEKGDVSDWLAAGRNEIGLAKLAGLAPHVTTEDVPEPVTRLDIVSGEEITEKPIEWTWQNRIPRGHPSMIVGDPGLGKSKLILDIACRRSKDGQRWPDGPCAPPRGTILFFTSEDNLEDTVIPRIKAMGGDPSRFKFVRMVKQADGREREFSLEDLQLLEQAVKDHQVTDVFIDPVSAFLGKADDHKTGSIRGLLGPLSHLAERYNLTIVVVMHLNKKEDQKVLYRVSGTVAFTAAARSVFLIQADPGQPETRRFLVHIKCNLSEYAPTLAFVHTGQAIRWETSPVTEVTVHNLSLAEGPEAPERESAKAWLRAALADGAQKAEDVKRWAKTNGYSARTLERAKAALKIVSVQPPRGADGAFEGDWFWSLPNTRERTVGDVVGCGSQTIDSTTPPPDRHLPLPRVGDVADGVVGGDVASTTPDNVIKLPVRDATPTVKRPVMDEEDVA